MECFLFMILCKLNRTTAMHPKHTTSLSVSNLLFGSINLELKIWQMLFTEVTLLLILLFCYRNSLPCLLREAQLATLHCDSTLILFSHREILRTIKSLHTLEHLKMMGKLPKKVNLRKACKKRMCQHHSLLTVLIDVSLILFRMSP